MAHSKWSLSFSLMENIKKHKKIIENSQGIGAWDLFNGTNHIMLVDEGGELGVGECLVTLEAYAEERTWVFPKWK